MILNYHAREPVWHGGPCEFTYPYTPVLITKYRNEWILHLVVNQWTAVMVGPRAASKCGLDHRREAMINMSDYNQSWIFIYGLETRWCKRCVDTTKITLPFASSPPSDSPPVPDVSIAP